MAGRPVLKKANVEEIQKIYNSSKQIIDPRPIIALTMKYCGALDREIAEVFGVSRETAIAITKKAEKKLCIKEQS